MAFRFVPLLLLAALATANAESLKVESLDQVLVLPKVALTWPPNWQSKQGFTTAILPGLSLTGDLKVNAYKSLDMGMSMSIIGKDSFDLTLSVGINTDKCNVMDASILVGVSLTMPTQVAAVFDKLCGHTVAFNQFACDKIVGNINPLNCGCDEKTEMCVYAPTLTSPFNSKCTACPIDVSFVNFVDTLPASSRLRSICAAWKGRTGSTLTIPTFQSRVNFANNVENLKLRLTQVLDLASPASKVVAELLRMLGTDVLLRVTNFVPQLSGMRVNLVTDIEVLNVLDSVLCNAEVAPTVVKSWLAKTGAAIDSTVCAIASAAFEDVFGSTSLYSATVSVPLVLRKLLAAAGQESKVPWINSTTGDITVGTLDGGCDTATRAFSVAVVGGATLTSDQLRQAVADYVTPWMPSALPFSAALLSDVLVTADATTGDAVFSGLMNSGAGLNAGVLNQLLGRLLTTDPLPILANRLITSFTADTSCSAANGGTCDLVPVPEANPLVTRSAVALLADYPPVWDVVQRFSTPLAPNLALEGSLSVGAGAALDSDMSISLVGPDGLSLSLTLGIHTQRCSQVDAVFTMSAKLKLPVRIAQEITRVCQWRSNATEMACKSLNNIAKDMTKCSPACDRTHVCTVANLCVACPSSAVVKSIMEPLSAAHPLLLACDSWNAVTGEVVLPSMQRELKYSGNLENLNITLSDVAQRQGAAGQRLAHVLSLLGTDVTFSIVRLQPMFTGLRFNILASMTVLDFQKTLLCQEAAKITVPGWNALQLATTCTIAKEVFQSMLGVNASLFTVKDFSIPLAVRNALVASGLESQIPYVDASGDVLIGTISVLCDQTPRNFSFVAQGATELTTKDFQRGISVLLSKSLPSAFTVSPSLISELVLLPVPVSGSRRDTRFDIRVSGQLGAGAGKDAAGLAAVLSASINSPGAAVGGKLVVASSYTADTTCSNTDVAGACDASAPAVVVTPYLPEYAPTDGSTTTQPLPVQPRLLAASTSAAPAAASISVAAAAVAVFAALALVY